MNLPGAPDSFSPEQGHDTSAPQPILRPGQFEDLGHELGTEAMPEAFVPQPVFAAPDVPLISPEPDGIELTPEKWTPDVFGFSFSFTDWCLSLCRKVLATNCAFSRFVASALPLRRDGPQAPSSALFPLPLPSFWPFAPVDPKMPGKLKAKRSLDRALHVVVCALNHAYCSRGFTHHEYLRRQPNEAQSRALKHLRLLVSACDPGVPIEVANSGRRNLQLLARLQELSSAAIALGFDSSPYHEGLSNHPVSVDNTKDKKLSPFSEVDPDRLKISGQGQWKAAQFMSPELYMPFVEPKILECEFPIYDRGTPNLMREKPERILRLLHKWDSLDLLELHPAAFVGHDPSKKVRIFGAFKDHQFDRQIGDRRLQNGFEARLPGPSRSLPTGSLLSRILVPPGQGLKICITDRADFYHQIGVTSQRSQTNCVWPPFKLDGFEGTKAHAKFVQKAQEAPRKTDRAVFGDNLKHEPVRYPRDAGPDTEVFGSFAAVLQGQLGVEFGIDSHAGLLVAHGLLADDQRLTSSRLVRDVSTHQGLVIDDFFSIAKVPVAELDPTQSHIQSPAYEVFQRAKKAYAVEGLKGSDPKDVIDKTKATVIGAEINSSLEVAQEGLITVAAPAPSALPFRGFALRQQSSHTPPMPYMPPWLDLWFRLFAFGVVPCVSLARFLDLLRRPTLIPRILSSGHCPEPLVKSLFLPQSYFLFLPRMSGQRFSIPFLQVMLQMKKGRSAVPLSLGRPPKSSGSQEISKVGTPGSSLLLTSSWGKQKLSTRQSSRIFLTMAVGILSTKNQLLPPSRLRSSLTSLRSMEVLEPSVMKSIAEVLLSDRSSTLASLPALTCCALRFWLGWFSLSRPVVSDPLQLSRLAQLSLLLPIQVAVPTGFPEASANRIPRLG